jgi:hypothetical protein
MAILICTIVLTGAAARIAPLFHDFWLDEAWSYLMVQELATTPADILTKLHTDNNHPLNSLAIYLLGNDVDWPVYRLPSWIAGVVCIPLAYAVMRRFGETHALYAMVLVAFSYPLIVYSTEARGYGMLLCNLLLAVESARRWLATREWLACGVFWVAAILGVLSHLTFVHAYLAILVYSVHELRRQSARVFDVLIDFTKCHAVPLLFLAALYWIFIRHVKIGGSAPTGLINALIEAITMALGGPKSGPFALLYVVGFLVLLFLGLHRMKIQSEGRHLLFVCGIVLVPLPLVTLRLFLHPESTSIFSRYFLTSVMLFLLLTGFLLGDLHERGRRAKITSGAVLALILSGNIVQTARFTEMGRGQYLQALRYMMSESPDGPIHVTSSSDFRTSLLCSFYMRYLPRERKIVYHSRQELDRSQTVEWWIVEFLETHQNAPQEVRTATGRFSLHRYFDFYGPSGCGWAVYRRTASE